MSKATSHHPFKSLTHLLVLSLFSCFVSANNDIDSLLHAINLVVDAEEKLEKLDSLCGQYAQRYDPTGTPLFEARQKLLDNLGNKQAAHERIYQTGYYYFTSEQNEKFGDFIQQYTAEDITKVSRENQAVIHFLHGCFLEYEGQNQKALDLIEKSIAISEGDLHFSESPAYRKALLEKGRITHAIGNLEESSTALNKSLDAHLAVNDTLGAEDCLVELGILFSQIGLYDEAEKYFRSRYNYIKPKPLTLALDLINLGRNLLLQSRYKEAVNYYREALTHGPFEGGNAHFLLFANNGLIEGLYFSGRVDSITFYFKQMSAAFDQLGRPDHFDFLLKQSRFLTQLISNRYTAAEKDAKDLYEDALASGDVSDLILSARYLSELYRHTGEQGLALKYSDIYHHAADSLKSVQKSNGLSLYQTQFETEKKESAIVKLESEKQLADARTRQWSIAAILLFMLLTVGGFLYLQLSRARKQIATSNQQLRDLNLTKDRFFGIIAHDLRNPIAALESVDRQMEFYLEKNDVPKLKRASQLVGKMSRNLNALLDNLLKWALSQTGRIPYHPKVVNASTIIIDTIQLFKDRSEEKGIALELDIGQDLHCFADSSALATTLRNLIHNAIKYSTNGDRVKIHARKSGDHLHIAVSDTGQGMSKDILNTLFKLDKKSKAGTAGEKGTGLGLILCKELVELNKGRLQVKSQAGSGSTFNFTVPVASS